MFNHKRNRLPELPFIDIKCSSSPELIERVERARNVPHKSANNVPPNRCRTLDTGRFAAGHRLLPSHRRRPTRFEKTPPKISFKPLQLMMISQRGVVHLPAIRSGRSQPAVRHPRVVRPLSGRQRRQQRRPAAAQLRLVHRSAVRHADATLRQHCRADGQPHRMRARLRAGGGGHAAGGRSRDGRLRWSGR